MLCRFFLFVTVIISAMPSCITQENEITYGLQTNHASFVPARVALLHCRPWPNGARYSLLPLSNFSDAAIAKLCKKFDRFVIDGYDGQPYMRGISQKAVERNLKKKLGDGFLKKIRDLWQHKASDCSGCSNPPAFYTESITNREKWREWLVQLSVTTKSADAILLPMITYAYDLKKNDRGVEINEKAAGLALMLIDTNNGYLLWSGGREAIASNHSFNEKTNSPPVPDEELLYERLFTEDIWKDFPGRQVYN